MKNSVKNLAAILLSCSAFWLSSCSEAAKKEPAKAEGTNLKTGGLYISKDKDGMYSISKILVIEVEGVHVRMYSDKFKTKPSAISSDSLHVLIGHAPMRKEGFLLDKPELLKVEPVAGAELEGYEMYLEAMQRD
jgi:hypothetical protein